MVNKHVVFPVKTTPNEYKEGFYRALVYMRDWMRDHPEYDMESLRWMIESSLKLRDVMKLEKEELIRICEELGKEI